MGTNLDEFCKEINDFTESIPEKVTELQKKIVLEALKRIVEKTPVDTGRARGNWQVAIDTPISDVLERTDKQGAETIQKGASAITDLPPFRVVWISNNLDYIEFLEDGSSKQTQDHDGSPQGMVALTMLELREIFK